MIGMAWVFAVCSEIHVTSAHSLVRKNSGRKKAGRFLRTDTGKKKRERKNERLRTQPFLKTKRRMATLRTSPIMQKLTTEALPP